MKTTSSPLPMLPFKGFHLTSKFAAINLFGISLALLATSFEAGAQSSRKPGTREASRVFSFAGISPGPSIGKAGSFYAVDEDGGFIRFNTPGKPSLVAESYAVYFDVAIKGDTAYYITSNGYLAKSDLSKFKSRIIASCGSFNAMDFSPSGKLYAMSHSSTYIYRLDTRTGKAQSLFNVGYYSDGDICFVNSSTVLLTSSSGQLVEIDLVARKSRVIMELGGGEWYSMDYRAGKIHLIDNATGNYFIMSYPSLTNKIVGNIYNNSAIAGLNGMSFR